MPTLEAQLTVLTQEFVAKVVDALRNASFAEVASLTPARVVSSRPKRVDPVVTPPKPSRKRQTAGSRAELGERILSTLHDATHPLGVRALSTELGVDPVALAVPLRELRTAGKIRKHGEKRSTTYSRA